MHQLANRTLNEVLTFLQRTHHHAQAIPTPMLMRFQRDLDALDKQIAGLPPPRAEADVVRVKALEDELQRAQARIAALEGQQPQDMTEFVLQLRKDFGCGEGTTLDSLYDAITAARTKEAHGEPARDVEDAAGGDGSERHLAAQGAAVAGGRKGPAGGRRSA